jgi:hypothetical protein
MLGMLAFGTSDMWMPYATGDFGSSQDDVPMPDNGDKTTQNLEVTGHSLSGNTVTGSWTFTNNGTTGTFTRTYEVISKCKRTSDNAIHFAKARATQNTGSGTVTATTTLPLTPCPAGYTTLGYVVGGVESNGEVFSPGLTGSGTVQFSQNVSSERGPRNQKRWGELTAAGFDPHGADVTYKTRSECIDAAGVKTWVEALTSGANGAVLVPSCAAAGKGQGTGRTQFIGVKPDGSEQILWDTGADPYSDPATPACDPGRAGFTGCTLQVEIDGKPCEAGNPECEDWLGTNQRDSTSTRVKCKFGPYQLPIAQCALLEQAYLPGGAPSSDENTDGNPDTRNWADPAGNPVTPTAPSITPNPGSVPGTGGQTGPGADADSKACYPSGWAALNPVEWVLKPVGCALRAAFVPSPTTVATQSQRVQDKINRVGFQRISAAWLATFDAAGGGGGGCSGPVMEFEMRGVHQTLKPFDACSEPMASVAALTNAFSCVVIVLFGGLGIMRAIASGFGFNFAMGKGD